MIKELAIAIAALTAPATASAQHAPARVSGDVFISYAESRDDDADTLLRPARAEPDPFHWLSAADYPAAALRARSDGKVGITVEIGADDRALRCTVTRPAADARLTAVPCPLVSRRGRFRHALAADGAPAASTVRLVITFELAGDESDSPPALVVMPPMADPENALARRAEPIDPDALVMRGAPSAIFPNRRPILRVDVDSQGVVTGCRIFGSSGTDQGDLRLCRQARTIRYQPQLDRAGKPVPTPGDFLFLELKP